MNFESVRQNPDFVSKTVWESMRDPVNSGGVGVIVHGYMLPLSVTLAFFYTVSLFGLP